MEVKTKKNTMKAMAFTQYGGPEVFKLMDLPKPVPKKGEVLIKVHAAGINEWDYGILKGEPFVNRLLFGLFKPRNQILGCDVAGRVAAVGEGVTDLKVGDAVFGDLSAGKWGGFAEYTCADANELALKPKNMTFEQAAALPQAGLLALKGFRFLPGGNEKPKILINGAGGGVGTFAIQLANMHGAEVTCVDHAFKLDHLLGMGAAHVLDYQKVDFTKNGIQYDFILDVQTNRPLLSLGNSLKPQGIYATVGGDMHRLVKLMILGSFYNKVYYSTSSKKLRVVIHEAGRKALMELVHLFENHGIKPTIDRIFPLRELKEAFLHYEKGNFVGKVVIKVCE